MFRKWQPTLSYDSNEKIPRIQVLRLNRAADDVAEPPPLRADGLRSAKPFHTELAPHDDVHPELAPSPRQPKGGSAKSVSAFEEHAASSRPVASAPSPLERRLNRPVEGQRAHSCSFDTGRGSGVGRR